MSGLRYILEHKLKNLALLALSLCLLPLNFTIFLAIDLLHRLRYRQDEAEHGKPLPLSERKTILITGVNMTKALALARTFHRAGHRVVAADAHFLAPGRVSRAVDAFYRLPVPKSTGVTAREPYVQKILAIVRSENVDLWVPASDVNGAMADAVARDVIEAETSAKAVQFRPKEIETLHEKDAFIEHTRSIRLHVPITQAVRTADEATAFLESNGGLEKGGSPGKQFLIKPINVDDLGRNDMPLLPLASKTETLQRVRNLRWPALRPDDPAAYIIQEFVSGQEFCTHALVVDGQVKIFLACPSQGVLMHYTALPATSALHKTMLEFTERQAASFGEGFTGHMSFDFLVREGEEMLNPIECNPRVHTAVVLLRDTHDVAAAYLDVLSDSPGRGSEESRGTIMAITPKRYYWIGQDFVEAVFRNLHQTLVLGTMSPAEYAQGVRAFLVHVWCWKDGLLETWDPWPCWWLYHVYWPAQFARYVVRGRWHQLNVSTGKAFQAA